VEAEAAGALDESEWYRCNPLLLLMLVVPLVDDEGDGLHVGERYEDVHQCGPSHP